jgi:hypothetical protein
MRAIYRTILVAIGTVALATSFSLPASAATPHYIFNNAKQEDIVYLDGGITFSSIPNKDFSVWASTTVDGHIYYDYKDAITKNCLQANTADTVMTEGGCDASSTRQFWWWSSSSTLLVNLAFGDDAYASGSEVKLGFGSGGPTSPYGWGIGD